MQIIAEEWRPVVGFDGEFEVSSDGHVRSLDRTVVDTRNGRCWKYCGRILSTWRNHHGYTSVSINSNSRKRVRLVHRLMAEAFFGSQRPGMEVNHKNGIRDDNRLENLEWCTRSENQTHAATLPHTPRGRKKGGPSYSDAQVRKVRELRRLGMSLRRIAGEVGMSTSHVIAITKNRTRLSA